MQRRRVNNPTGGHALHYDIVKHIKKTHPDVLLTSGLGENQIIHYLRSDSYQKGYESGTPDIGLNRKVGYYTCVVCN